MKVTQTNEKMQMRRIKVSIKSAKKSRNIVDSGNSGLWRYQWTSELAVIDWLS